MGSINILDIYPDKEVRDNIIEKIAQFLKGTETWNLSSSGARDEIVKLILSNIEEQGFTFFSKICPNEIADKLSNLSLCNMSSLAAKKMVAAEVFKFLASIENDNFNFLQTV